MTRDQLMQALKKAFPDMWVKESEEFHPAYTCKIWTGEGATHEGVEIFNYFAGTTSIYEDSIMKKVREFVEYCGWHFEWYHAGTIFICKN